ncbi:hypothetical protein MLD38_019960 [Melastoma candidum]|uniref:Uncharacterized protein n=1 Tax=Melastoma candidum TaxID=119954 RepID=A0ACB9QCQ6_9MYRT|nr:hypothetical protein MLD38_019960 [Melastoma candidum]
MLAAAGSKGVGRIWARCCRSGDARGRRVRCCWIWWHLEDRGVPPSDLEMSGGWGLCHYGLRCWENRDPPLLETSGGQGFATVESRDVGEGVIVAVAVLRTLEKAGSPLPVVWRCWRWGGGVPFVLELWSGTRRSCLWGDLRGWGRWLSSSKLGDGIKLSQRVWTVAIRGVADCSVDLHKQINASNRKAASCEATSLPVGGSLFHDQR